MPKRLLLLTAALVAVAAPPASAGPDIRSHVLKDIWPGPKSSSPTRLVANGRRVFFAASSPNAGHELWSTNGTRRGTKLVADIVPGKTGSVPRGLTSDGEHVFFTVLSEDRSSRRLWQSDGTAAGTHAVAGTDELDVSSPRGADGFVLFTAIPPGADGPETWAADGDAPAVRLTEGLAGVPTQALGTTLVTLWDEAHGLELWRTDGTSAGTQLVRDIAPGPESSGPAGITQYGDRALFFAGPGLAGSELWSTDGTEAGTTRIAAFDERFSLYVDHTALLDGSMLFTLDNQELWRTDGTTGGTVATGVRTEGNFVELRDRVGETQYIEIRTSLWRTDGTEAGTRPVARWLFEPSNLVDVGGAAVFAAGSRKLDRELWQTDGTKKGTRLVRDIWPGDRGSRIAWMTDVGRRAVFAAYDGRKHGLELWVAEVDRRRGRAG